MRSGHSDPDPISLAAQKSPVRHDEHDRHPIQVKFGWQRYVEVSCRKATHALYAAGAASIVIRKTEDGLSFAAHRARQCLTPIRARSVAVT